MLESERLLLNIKQVVQQEIDVSRLDLNPERKAQILHDLHQEKVYYEVARLSPRQRSAMSRQSTDKQLIEAIDKAIREKGLTGEQMQYYLDLIDDLRGENANRTYHGPPVEVDTGEFSRGKARHR